MIQQTRDKLRLVFNRSSLPVRAYTDSYTPAAVLVPIFERSGQDHLLLIKRTDSMHRHAGQIAFPGGVKEDCDATLLDTALREGYEEVGLKPEDVDVLGEMDAALTGQDFRIFPFVCTIPHPYQYRLCEAEVACLLEVPVKSLMDPSIVRTEMRERNGQPVKVYYYDYNGYSIWGATARIVRQLLQIGYDCQ